jgi:PAS domain S-box-containing protein
MKAISVSDPRVARLSALLRDIFRHREIWVGVLVAAAYYAGAQLGFLLVFPGSPLSIIWPPNAILLAALLLVPTRTWWVLLLAVLPAHLLVEWHNGVLTWTVFGLYLTNCAEAVLGAAALRHFASGPPWLSTPRQIAYFVAYAAIAAPFLVSFADTAVIVLTRWGPSQHYWLLWQERFISNVLTYLTVTPVILIGARIKWHRLRAVAPLRMVEAALLALAVLGTSYLAIVARSETTRDMPGLLFALAPVLFWAAVRFGVGGTSAVLLVITVFAALWTGTSEPLDARSPTAVLLELQLFLIVISAPALFLAALMAERKQASLALLTSEARYRDLLESQTEMICRFLPDSTLTYVNDAYCRWQGKGRDQLIGSRFLDTLDESARKHHLEYVAALLANPHTAVDEHEVMLPDGSIGWQQWVDHVVYDGHGTAIELQSIGRDITERKRMEQALRASEARYRDLVETQDDLICRYLPDGTLTFVNNAYCSAFGRSREALIGTSFVDLIPPSQARRARESVTRTLNAPGVVLEEHEVILPDGRQVWQQWVEHAIRGSDGTVSEIQAVGRDVTERKQALDALESLSGRLLQLQDEERRRLARELHDGTAQNIVALNLNLSTLRGLARDARLDREQIERLLSDSQALSEESLREMRTLSYLLHPPQLDEAGLVPAIQWYVQGFSQRSGIGIDLVTPTVLGRLSPELERALFRVVQECLSNVHRHSGSATARIVLQRTDRTVRLVVSDRGGGIAGSVASDGRSATDDIIALGVGIPGMRQRLRQLGGQLEVHSSHRGTSVVATVPSAGSSGGQYVHSHAEARAAGA